MKRTYKRAVTLLVTLAMSVGLCFGLAACGGGGQSDEQMIRAELDEAFAVLKNPTEDSVKAMLGDNTAALDELEQYGVDPVDMLKHFFGHFDYTIDSVKVDGDKGVATVTITNADIQSVMNDVMSNLQNDEEFMSAATAAYMANDNKGLYKLIFDKLFKAVDETDKLVTTTTDFQLEKKDGAWDFTDEGKQALMSSMFGGMDLSQL